MIIYGHGGENDYGQCGHKKLAKGCRTPEIVHLMSKFKIECIDCGAYHSYSKTRNGGFY